MKDDRLLRMLKRLEGHYADKQKALIAHALVLWRGKPVKDIKQFLDGESAPVFRELLADLSGPVFYYKKDDRFYLRRWAGVLLGEGKDSKAFTHEEEESLYDFVYEIRCKYHRGFVTPKDI